MDENFDGRISYRELRDHIRGLGFTIDNDVNPSAGALVSAGARKPFEAFIWRDKGIEVAIRVLHKHLNKKTFEEFFK